jgi:iron complex outermembrane recepter protein
MSRHQRRRQFFLSSVWGLPTAFLGGALALVSVSVSVPARAAEDAPSAPAAAASATPASATSAVIEEVTITARDRAEKDQDVPLPISAIGEKKIAEQHIEKWSDIVQRVPSFTPSLTNARTSANGLRGITGISGGADGSEGDVGLIVDNVFLSYIGFSFLSLYDVSSVQVARGPQGTLLGKNTTTGAVIINNNIPSFTPQTTTETTLGSRRLVEETFTTTGPLIPDTIAYRVSVFGAKQDGWLPNLYGNTNLKGQDTDRWGVRLQLLGTFGDITDRFIYSHFATSETTNSNGTWNDGWVTNYNGTPRAISATDPANLKKTFTNPNQALAWLYPQYASRIAPQPFATVYTNIGSIDTHSNLVSNELNWNINNLTLTSVSAFAHFDFHPNNSNGNYGIQAIDNNISGYDVGANQYSQELRLSSPTGEKIEWTAGTYFLREQITSNDRMRFGPDAVGLLQRNTTNTGLNQSSILNGVESDLYGQAGITTLAAFGQGTYHYDEHAALTFGLRDSYEDRTASDLGYYFGGAQLPKNLTNVRTNYVISEIGGTNFDLSGEQKTNSVSFLLNPSYKFNDNITAYFNVARGVKSGAADTVAVPVYYTNSTYNSLNQVYPAIGTLPIITAPEISIDYELGFKSNWLDNHLIFNANAYLNTITNFQATLTRWYTYTDTSGNLNVVNKSFLGNIPSVRLAGFELEGRYSPLDNLWINWAASYNGAWYWDFPDAAPAADYSAVYPSAQLNLSHQRIPNVTPYTFIIGFNYEQNIGEHFGASLKAYGYVNEAFKSTTFFNVPSFTNLYLQQGSYSVLSAGAGVKTLDEKYDLVVWAKNLGNVRAMTTQTLSTNVALGGVSFIDPLTVGATLRTKF